jgi:hypothetical protein
VPGTFSAENLVRTRLHSGLSAVVNVHLRVKGRKSKSEATVKANFIGRLSAVFAP